MPAVADHAFGPGSVRPDQPPGAPFGDRKTKSTRSPVESVTPSAPVAPVEEMVSETPASAGTSPATVICQGMPPVGVSGTEARSAGLELVTVSGSTAPAGAARSSSAAVSVTASSGKKPGHGVGYSVARQASPTVRVAGCVFALDASTVADEHRCRRRGRR